MRQRAFPSPAQKNGGFGLKHPVGVQAELLHQRDQPARRNLPALRGLGNGGLRHSQKFRKLALRAFARDEHDAGYLRFNVAMG